MIKTVLAALACFLVAGMATPSGAAPLPEKFLVPRQVVIQTSLGPIRIRLFPDKAPATVGNFLLYVDENFYDGTVFHRVIPNFMIQGGGHDANLAEKKARQPIRNESTNGLANRRGTLAMARAANPDSATCQFFINLKDNTSLDRSGNQAGYCVFGEVIQGLEVVDKIAQVATGEQGVFRDVPIEPVLIRSIRRAP